MNTSRSRLVRAAAVGMTFCSLGFPLPAQGGPLEQAEIHKIVNDVRLVDPARATARPAALRDIVKDDLAVRTGIQSRAELLFQDKTLTRLGAETLFSFKVGTRDMKLDQGTMLLQVPKGLGGARIRTAAVTAAITGTTIMVENEPGKHVKVLVIEGSLRLSVNGRLGESTVLNAGKMIIMGARDKQLPKPVDVDLAKVVKTSALIDPAKFRGSSKTEVDPLPSIGLIQQQIAMQEELKGKAGLAETNLVINGEGTNVIIAPKEAMAALEQDTNKVATELALINQVEQSSDHLKNSVIAANKADKKSRTAKNAASGKKNGTTSVPVPSSTPYPRPNPAAMPNPNPPPATTVNAPPVSLAGTLNIQSTTMIGSGAGSSNIKEGGNSYAGSLYGGSTSDGPAAYFLFGSDTAYDQARDFNGTFGTQSLQSFPTAGVAVFEFGTIQFSGVPTFNIGTGASDPKDFALVAAGNIMDSGGAAFKVNLDKLTSLVLATVNGSITLSNAEFSAGSRSGIKFLQLHARGASSNISVNSKINIPNASLFMDSPGTLNIGSQADIKAKWAVLNSSGAMTIDGKIEANALQLYSETSVQLNKLASPTKILHVFAPALWVTVPVSVDAGTVEVGAGGINTNGQDFIGFSSISSLGSIISSNLSASGNITAGGEINIEPSGARTISAANIVAGGGIQSNGASGTLTQAPGAGGNVTLNVSQAIFDSTGINGANLNGGDAVSVGPGGGAGGDGGTLAIGSGSKPVTGSVTFNAPISATTGANAGATTGGNGGTVNVVSNDTIAVNSTVKVSESTGPKTSRGGGNIHLESRKSSGTAISVSNSGQLYALLSSVAPGAGGKVTFVSAGGDINVNGGTLQADRGTVEIRNNGRGNINLTNATLRGDVVKANALGANGQLNIGGGSIDADTAIKLYAGGANGSVNFRDNVRLNGNSVKTIAANTVTINNGKVVTINGPSAARVFTNHANYSGSGGNGSTTGAFAGQGASTQPFNQAPSY